MTKLFKHQQDLINRFPQSWCLVWGTGTGKTRAVLALASKVGKPFLIICPKGLKENWKMEIEKWGGGLAHKVMSKEEFRRDWDKLDRYKGVIVDEAHYFFGMNSAMMKSLRKYFGKWDKEMKMCRYFLTATPYRSTPWDIYKMCELVGKPLNYLWFKNHFFHYIDLGYRVVPKPRKGIEKELAEIVNQVGNTVKLEDCFDVPDQVFETEYFELTRSQVGAMNKVIDPLPVVRYGQMHQICGGVLASDGYNSIEDTIFHSDKMDRVMELVADNNRMIIVCKYLKEIEVLFDKLMAQGINVARITGDVAGADRHETLNILKRSSKYVLLVSAGCCEGWSLEECPLMVFYSLSFSLLHEVQMRGRIQRADNIKKNTYLYLVCKDTIDEDIYETITIKKRDFHLAIYESKKSAKQKIREIESN